jgi:hypothetical protein
MATVVEAGNPKNLSASGAISTGPGSILGFYVNTTSSGVIVIKDGGSSGTALSGSITPAAGTFHRFPASIGTSAYMTLSSGSINVTFFFVPAN